MCLSCNRDPETYALATAASFSHCPNIRELPPLPRCRELYCDGCPLLERLPDLPECRQLQCQGCPKLTQLGALPECTHLNTSRCPLLTQLPELPRCEKFYCSNCVSLRELPPLPRLKRLHSEFCTGLVLIHNMGYNTYAPGTFFTDLTEEQEHPGFVRALGRPYRLKLQPYWSRWRRRARRRAQLRVLTGLLHVYPGLKDVLGRLVP